MVKPIFLLLFTILTFISPTTTSFAIECKFGLWKFLHVGDLYTCQTQNSQFPSNHTITETYGTHQAGKTNADVKAIYIQGRNSIPFFPRGFTRFFPNVIAIHFGYAAFETLHGNELLEYGQQLQYFYLFYSALTTVSSQLFEARPNLALVRFEYNSLRRVGRELFTPLNVTLLKEVNFKNNPCISRWEVDESKIRALIDELRVVCRWDDEVVATTTEITPTTSVAISSSSSASKTSTPTTPAVATCFDTKIEDFVCELKDELKLGLTSTVNGLQNQLDETNQKLEAAVSEQAATKAIIDRLQSEMQWMTDELLRMTTHPCACK
jgi:hypothetical protein